jgi:hypothetical protein
MQAVENFLKGVTIYGVILLIFQFCLNVILERFSVQPASFLEVLCGFVLVSMSVFFGSLAWHKGK